MTDRLPTNLELLDIAIVLGARVRELRESLLKIKDVTGLTAADCERDNGDGTRTLNADSIMAAIIVAIKRMRAVLADQRAVLADLQKQVARRDDELNRVSEAFGNSMGIGGCNLWVAGIAARVDEHFTKLRTELADARRSENLHRQDQRAIERAYTKHIGPLPDTCHHSGLVTRLDERLTQLAAELENQKREHSGVQRVTGG